MSTPQTPPPPPPPVQDLTPQITQLQGRIDELEKDLAREQAAKRDSEKEQEDLLVFLDEMSAKRKRDKERLKAAGQDVSEDEAGDNDAEEEEEED